MSADIVERLESFASVWPTAYDSDRQNIALLRETAAEIVRLRGEVAFAASVIGRYAVESAIRGDGSDTIAPAEAKGLAPAMPNGVEADWNCIISVLEHGMRDGIHGGYNASYIKQQIAALRAADNRDAAGVDGEGWPPCPQCKAGILYECPACSSTNYPRDAIAPQPAAGEAVADVVLHDGLLYGRLRGDLPVGTKLYTAPAAVPAGEAVAWLASDGEVFTDKESADRHSKVWGVNPLLTPLYTTPPAPVQAAPQEGEAAELAKQLNERVDSVVVAGATGNESILLAEVNKLLGCARMVAVALSNQAAHPSACELGAVRDAITETVLKYADNNEIPPGLFRDEMFAAVTAALQHRGDSRGGEGV